MDLFNNLYYPWVGQIRLTSALKGRERNHQSFINPEPQMDQAFTYWDKRKVKKEAKGRKKLLSYLQPGDQGGGNIYD
jgi:fido (protein-threonine AMPylation protein)